jgi:hypothetical protein
MSRAQLTSTDQQNTGGAVAPYVAGKNAVINGGYDIWQRGTSFTIAARQYTADRFESSIGAMTAGTLTVSRQSAGLTGFNYALRFQRNSGATTTGSGYLTYSMESNQFLSLQGKAITFSFYARAGANYSMTGSTVNLIVNTGTGTDENINNGLTGSANIISSSPTLTTSWQRFAVNATVSSTATELGFYFQYAGTGTAGANDYFDITGIQLELGSTATPFSRSGGTYQGELALCQRYYQRISSINATTAYMHFGMGQAYSTSAAKVPIPLKVTMRTAPSISSTGSIGLLNSVNSAINNASLAVESGPGNSPDVCSLVATGSSGLTAGNATTLIANANNTCYLEISAEL